MDKKLVELAASLGAKLQEKQRYLVTAESCTGGWLGQILTSVPGSSSWFERGYICYSNLAKTEMLGVPGALINQYGAVSAEIARALAEGALNAGQISMAITGIAGPDGGSEAKPVGTVYFGLGFKTSEGSLLETKHQLFTGDREQIRHQAVAFALQWLKQFIVEH